MSLQGRTFDAVLLLRLLLNRYDHLCVSFKQFCTIAVLTTQTLDRYNENIVMNERKLGMFDNSLLSKRARTTCKWRPRWQSTFG